MSYAKLCCPCTICPPDEEDDKLDVLLTFVGTRDPRWKPPKSIGEKDGPILSLLSERPFDHVFLFSNEGTATNAADTKAVLQLPPYEFRGSSIEIKPLPVNDPTDYVTILAGLRRHILELMGVHPQARFYFAGSSGTPQMQASAMLLVMSGFIEATFLLTRDPQFVGPPVTEFDFADPEFPRVSFWSRKLEAESIPESELMQRAKDVGIIGDHPKLIEAIREAERYARYDCSVLLLGETGTGKELFAQFIRERSSRKDGHFIKVNCAELPETTAESELFGHEKGAFTGAVQRKLGLMEVAKGGTLFLDELQRLEPKIQAKLLRAVEQKTIKRLGGTREVDVDLRLIFGTNRDLREMEEEGLFLQDLRYRIGQWRVKIPPLRDRRTDVPTLAQHFLDRFTKSSSESFELSDSAITKLLNYSWPGNVRELKNIIEDCCMRADKPLLDATDLKMDIEVALPPQLPALPDPYMGFSLDTFETDIRHHYMRRALELVGGGNKSEAARRFGMEPRTFHKYWKEHNLDIDKS